MNRIGPGVWALVFFVLVLLLLVLVAGCAHRDPVCVWKETGRKVADRLCSLELPGYEWRKA